jgi:hypothetical protein
MFASNISIDTDCQVEKFSNIKDVTSFILGEQLRNFWKKYSQQDTFQPFDQFPLAEC